MRTRSLDQLVTTDPTLAAVFGRVRRLARSSEPVLVLGETGTGKEGIARALHRLSPRSDRPFEALNCGVLSGDTATSELMGHERGAFTSAAQQHTGVFERAEGGTVFLDEVGELDPAVQTRLLRVLETRQVRRLGGSVRTPCDFRLVCATHQELSAASGAFREDLFYRVAVIVLRLPPLRERPGDVVLLAQRFLQQVAPDLTLSDAAAKALERHRWPGNVRELRNTVQRLAMETEGPVVRPEDVRLARGDVPPPPRRPLPSMVRDGGVQPVAVGGRSLEAVRRDVIRYEVARQRGNVTAAARVLGVARSTVYGVLRRAGSVPAGAPGI